MKHQNFGIEIELTGITRRDAAKVMANYFGTTEEYVGGTYRAYRVKDREGRIWKAVYDSSIHAETKQNGYAGDDYKCEIVSPICVYDDIETIQEIIRELRRKRGDSKRKLRNTLWQEERYAESMAASRVASDLTAK